MTRSIRSMVRGAGRRLRRLARGFAPVARAESYALNRRLTAQKKSLHDLASDPRPVTLFFAPEAGIVSHFVANCLIAKTLQERGHRVLMVRCFDIYPRCVVMDGTGLAMEPDPASRRATCLECAHSSFGATTAYGLDVVDLRDVIDAATYRDVDRMMTDLPEDLSTVTIDGIKFGAIAGAEAAVTFKVADFTGADPTVRTLLIRYLRGALLSYRAMQRLMQTAKIAHLVHYSEYGMLLGAVLA